MVLELVLERNLLQSDKWGLMRKLSSCVIVGALAFASQLYAQDGVETSGDFLQTALPAAALASTLIWKDGQPATLQFAKTIVTSFGVTHVLKRVVNKPRPNGGDHAWPSGHTSSAFTGAAFLQIRHGWRVGIPAYLLAGYVGWTRAYVDAHDYWDFLGGVIVGVGSAYLFATPYDPDRVAISLGKRDGDYSIEFSFQF
jgi:membrane-associated phospholipid phosphatase